MGSKFDAGGTGCLLSTAHSGKFLNMCSATEILARSMNSSTMLLVSSIGLLTTSIGSLVSLLTSKRISGLASSKALKTSQCLDCNHGVVGY